MGVVNLTDEIGDGVSRSPWARKDAQSLVVGRKAEFWPEVTEDVGDMCHDHVAVAQEWRREGRARPGLALKHRHQRLDAATAASYRLARDVDIGRPSFLERGAAQTRRRP